MIMDLKLVRDFYFCGKATILIYDSKNPKKKPKTVKTAARYMGGDQSDLIVYQNPRSAKWPAVFRVSMDSSQKRTGKTGDGTGSYTFVDNARVVICSIDDVQRVEVAALRYKQGKSTELIVYQHPKSEPWGDVISVTHVEKVNTSGKPGDLALCDISDQPATEPGFLVPSYIADPTRPPGSLAYINYECQHATQHWWPFGKDDCRNALGYMLCYPKGLPVAKGGGKSSSKKAVSGPKQKKTTEKSEARTAKKDKKKAAAKAARKAEKKSQKKKK